MQLQVGTICRFQKVEFSTKSVCGQIAQANDYEVGQWNCSVVVHLMHTGIDHWMTSECWDIW